MLISCIWQSCGSLAWGKPEKQTLKISLNLKNYGYDVTLLCHPEGRLAREAVAFGISTLYIFCKSPKYFKQFFYKIKYLSPEIIHAHISRDLLLLTPLLNFAKWKGVFFLTKYTEELVSKDNFLYRYIYQKIDHIFCVSRYVRDSLPKTFPVIKKHQMSILPNSIRLSNFKFDSKKQEQWREIWKINQETIVTAVIGCASQKEGYQELLEAIRLLIFKEGFIEIVFICVGEPNFREEDYNEWMDDWPTALVLKKYIRFIPSTEALSETLSAVDMLLVLSSYKEAYNSSILFQAMAASLPIIEAVGDSLDVVIHQRTGLRIPAKSPIDLAKGLKELLLFRVLRDVYGAYSYYHVQEKYTDNDFFYRLLLTYQSYYLSKFRTPMVISKLPLPTNG